MSTFSWTRYESRLGSLTLTADAGGRLSGLHFPGRGPVLAEADHRPDLLADSAAQLDRYFAGEIRAFGLELDLSAGTPFQRAVWDALGEIPYGATSTYSEVARRIGRPDRVRAVGAAIGRNPLPVLVPCHRVVGADGALTGYSGGLQRKRLLLDHEAATAAGEPAVDGARPRQLALL
jgi:methylated-DNA-[protein]-cysteine S-methyltransferase